MSGYTGESLILTLPLAQELRVLKLHKGNRIGLLSMVQVLTCAPQLEEAEFTITTQKDGRVLQIQAEWPQLDAMQSLTLRAVKSEPAARIELLNLVRTAYTYIVLFGLNHNLVDFIYL
jgi:hypothetical protein